MTGLSKVFDAATPPSTVPPGCTGALGYIGRPGFAARTWVRSDWMMFAHLAQFPCWVPKLTNHAGLEAGAITQAAIRAGFAATAARPLAVVIDYEANGAAEATWHADLADALGAVHYDAIAYGSLSSIMAMGAAHVWTAAWDNSAHLEPDAMTVHAHQYLAGVIIGGTQVDYSIADPWLMSRALRRA